MKRLFFFILSILLFSYPLYSHEQPKVIIVGAGLSGLSAAYRLEKLGYQVEIYEARERAGGRVFTAYFGDTYEELGGKNLKDGGEAKSIKALIHELGVPLSTKVSKSRPTPYYDGSRKVLVADLFDKAPAPAPAPDQASFQFLQEAALRTKTVQELLDLFFSKTPRLGHFMHVALTGWEGSSPDTLDAKYFADSLWAIYPRLYKRSQLPQTQQVEEWEAIVGGNSRLIEALVASIEGPTYYSSPLRKISTEGKRILLHFGGENPKVVKADYLLLTLPCTTLRDVQIEKGLFPEDQMLAINTWQYGTSAKILLPVKMNEEKISRSAFSETFCSWVSSDQKMLTLYYGAKEGRFNPSSKEEMLKRIQGDLPAIQILYPDVQFPLGSTPTPAKDSQTHYQQPVAISWINEEFSKCGYSNCGVGQFDLIYEPAEEYGEEIRKVCRSIGGKIFFAGEHTAIENYATLEGAVFSGERAARMMDRALKEEADGMSKGSFEHAESAVP